VLCEECWPDRGCKICPVCRQKEDGKAEPDPQIEPEIIERAKITIRDLDGLGAEGKIFAYALMKIIQSLAAEIKVASSCKLSDGTIPEKARNVMANLMAARIQLEEAIREFVKR
jgi:hypothetical protein